LGTQLLAVSRRTEKTYVGWIKRYIFLHSKRHPAEMGAAEVTRFLTWLATEGNVAASTQNQAPPRLMALLLYRAGHRLLECARLRVKDVDTTNQIVVGGGKGAKDRVTMLPAIARPATMPAPRFPAAMQQRLGAEVERHPRPP
jgi:site-specific recombinase XerD